MTTVAPFLRPPLPPPTSHGDVLFIIGEAAASRLAPEVVASIATALNALLPAGDLTLSESGHLTCCTKTSESAWSVAARLEGVSRSSL